MIKKTAPSPSKARKQVKKATKISGLPKPSSNATKTKAGLKKKIEKNCWCRCVKLLVKKLLELKPS